MLFNPSRDEARNFLFESWRKRRANELLTPLEDLAAQLIAKHPEFHAAFEDSEALEERVKFNNSEADFIEESLSDIPGLVIFHSRGNYILFDAGALGKKGKDMVQYAEEHELIFRPNNPMYDSEGWFRITIGTAAENRQAIKVVRDFLTK